MELGQLEAFVSVVEQKNFHRAAKSLHLTQPAITTRIANLELELNAELFVREGRNVRLSPCGEILLSYAKRILSLTGESKNSINSYKSGQNKRLIIGTTNRIGTYVLPDFVKIFLKDHPDIEIVIYTEKTSKILEMLSDGLIHIAISNFWLNETEYHVQPLFEDFVILVVSPSHPLSDLYFKNKSVTLEELSSFCIIKFNYEENYYQTIIDLFARDHITPSRYISVNSIEMMKKMVINGVGAAFLPKTTVNKEVEEGQLLSVQLSPKEQLSSRLSYLIYRKSQYINPCIPRFISKITSFVSKSYHV